MSLTPAQQRAALRRMAAHVLAETTSRLILAERESEKQTKEKR